MHLYRRAHFNISNIFFHTSAHFCANLNKTTAKQPSFIYQVANSVNIIYHIEKWIRKVDTTQICQIVCK